MSSDDQHIKFVFTDDGRRLTLNDLPPANVVRWITRRKSDVVQAVRGGLLTSEEALERYSLSAEELAEWVRMIDRYGTQGLRTTRLRHYRMREQLENDKDDDEDTLQ